MYQTFHISKFIEQVNDEAEKAAQAVFNKHNAEFRRKILAQMKSGDELVLGMGTATFLGNNTESKEVFARAISQIQYLEQRAGFEIEDFKKK